MQNQETKNEPLIVNYECGVYWIKNKIDGKVYVGSSKHIRRRMWQHRNALNKGTHTNRHLQGSWNKYGEHAFVIEELCWCSIENRAEMEKYLCDVYGALDQRTGFNIGDPLLVSVSEETRRRMSEGMKGVNTWMKGKKLDRDRVERSAAGHRGQKRSIESRIRYRASKMGSLNPASRVSESTRAEMRGLRLAGWKLKPIAEKFSVSVSYTSSVCLNRNRISRLQNI